MGVILGGDTAWKVRAKGDIVCAYHWINAEPALCLYPRQKKLGAGAYVIALSVAHLYARSDGYPTRYLIEASGRAAAVMGMDVTGFTIHRIADIIIDGLEDLVKMPPEPPMPKKKGRHLGEISLKSDGKVIAEGEVDMPEMIEVPSMTRH